MNCYQVRDQISSYIEKELTLPQIKQFETHLAACSDCRDTYDGVVSVIHTLRDADTVTASERFDSRLKSRLERLSDRPVGRPNRFIHRGTILGFEPRYAVMSLAAMVAIVILSVSLFPGGESGSMQGPVSLTTRQSLPNPSPGSGPDLSRSPVAPQMADDSREDTTGNDTDQNGAKPSYEDQIRLVKDRR